MSNKKTDEQLLLSKIKNSQAIYIDTKVVRKVGVEAGAIYSLLIVQKLEQWCNNGDTSLKLVYDFNELSHNNDLSKQQVNDAFNRLAHYNYIKVINSQQIMLNNFQQEIDNMKKELLR